MLYVALGLLALGSFLLFLVRWQSLLPALLVFLPFSGILILWSQQDPVFLLAKDLLYCLPLYVALFLLRPNLLQGTPIPAWLTLACLALALVVVLQMMNPGVVNLGMALIGAKVWLFYIPLAWVAAALVRTPADLVRLLRILVAVAVAPCLLGLAQWGLSESLGYRQVMTDIYGEAAAGATQNFTQFNMGGVIRRIPSTFSNSSSYFVFVLASLAAALALQATDWSRLWRIFARCVVFLLVVAGLLSGMRAAFVFLPLALVIYFMIGGRGLGTLGGALLLVLTGVAFLYLTGFDTDELAEGVAEHTNRYQEADFTWVQFSYALENSPFGSGTGTNTVSARYAVEGLSGAALASIGFYEVQYAKTVHELGLFGLVPFVILVGGLAARAAFGGARLADPRLRRAHAAIGCFVLLIFLYFFKAWIIDVDPGNVYFWLFAGLLYRIGAMDQALARQAPLPRPLGRPLPRQPLGQPLGRPLGRPLPPGSLARRQRL